MLSAHWKYGLCALPALAITIGLGLMIRSVTATEFVPRPTDRIRSSGVTYASLPYEYDCVRNVDHMQSIKDLYMPVSTPPMGYRPRCYGHPSFENHYGSQRTNIPQKHIPTKPEISFPELGFGPKLGLVDDGHCHDHLLRLPPEFPPRFLTGETSGFCEVSFIYDESGTASEVDILSCTHESLETPTRKSVELWRICSERATKQQRQETTVRYQLMDEDGKILPYP